MNPTPARDLLWAIRQLLSHADSVFPLAQACGHGPEFSQVLDTMHSIYDKLWEEVTRGRTQET